jgi:hypothetical protein
MVGPSCAKPDLEQKINGRSQRRARALVRTATIYATVKFHTPNSYNFINYVHHEMFVLGSVIEG